MSRPAYPSEVTDQEWDFVVPSLTLMKEDAPPREYPLRELFSALRWFVPRGRPVAHAAQRSATLDRRRAAGQGLDARRLF